MAADVNLMMGVFDLDWKVLESKVGSKGALVRYACITCGQEAFRSSGPPKACLARIGAQKR